MEEKSQELLENDNEFIEELIIPENPRLRDVDILFSYKDRYVKKDIKWLESRYIGSFLKFNYSGEIPVLSNINSQFLRNDDDDSICPHYFLEDPKIIGPDCDLDDKADSKSESDDNNYLDKSSKESKNNNFDSNDHTDRKSAK